ncbi:hypothetical protein DL769_004963 [Monosporascus sp. CRB-8-3]|nr:hypothetical protein DL769_004963 [Monosporascus sp. CRB-8-3]
MTGKKHWCSPHQVSEHGTAGSYNVKTKSGDTQPVQGQQTFTQNSTSGNGRQQQHSGYGSGGSGGGGGGGGGGGRGGGNCGSQKSSRPICTCPGYCRRHPKRAVPSKHKPTKK